MAKGDTCPKCGKQTFHHDRSAKPEGAMTCSQCGARGWLGHPDPMLGKGKACFNCGKAQAKNIGTSGAGADVQFCYGCGAVVIT